MEISEAQYNRLLTRLTALEERANDMAVAIDQFITLGQVNELLTTMTADLQAAVEQVEALEERVTALENEPLD